MKKERIKLSRANKILLTLYELSEGKKKNLRFEDIVVALFKKYKNDFHLRGYPQYPDSETVEKAIYSNLKKNGLVTYGNKIFSLTDKGLAFAKNLQREIHNKKLISVIKLPRYIENEISRIKNLEGFKLFIKGEVDRILDTDFYSYLGVSVRSEKDEFLGRLTTLNDVINELQKIAQKEVLHEQIINYHKFILNKFKQIIEYYKKN
jgi:hypothetical protein